MIDLTLYQKWVSYLYRGSYTLGTVSYNPTRIRAEHTLGELLERSKKLFLRFVICQYLPVYLTTMQFDER
jgi:hypothetical protein